MAAAFDDTGFAERIVVEPADTGVALCNPGMGWVLYHYDHHLSRYASHLPAHDALADFPGISTVYMAIPWSFLEPREGVYNWAMIDTVTQRWGPRGKQIALRFPCCEPFYAFATPEWVKEEGASFDCFETTERTRSWIQQSLGCGIPAQCWAPDYDDPLFLEKHSNFLRAAAERYDGSEQIAFIDVGSFGTWGEGHTSHSGGKKYTATTKIKHLDLYARHFRKTLLVAGDDLLKIDHVDDRSLIDRAVELGMALRDDSVLVGSRDRIAESEEMAQRFWPHQPVIIETAHYGMATDWWDSWGDGSGVLESVERYHASYLSIHWWPRDFLKKNRELIEAVNRRLGYRITINRVSWPATLAPGEPWQVHLALSNTGVAPCFLDICPAITLKDPQQGIVAVLTLPSYDVKRLPPRQKQQQPQAIPADVSLVLPETMAVPDGDYDVFFSLGTVDGYPKIAMALEEDDGQRRYCLGKVRILKNR